MGSTSSVRGEGSGCVAGTGLRAELGPPPRPVASLRLPPLTRVRPAPPAPAGLGAHRRSSSRRSAQRLRVAWALCRSFLSKAAAMTVAIGTACSTALAAGPTSVCAVSLPHVTSSRRNATAQRSEFA